MTKIYNVMPEGYVDYITWHNNNKLSQQILQEILRILTNFINCQLTEKIAYEVTGTVYNFLRFVAQTEYIMLPGDIALYNRFGTICLIVKTELTQASKNDFKHYNFQ